MKRDMIKHMAQTIAGKRVVLFWSGGFESTYLLKLMIQEELYRLCSLEVVMIQFPQEIYDPQKLRRAMEELDRLGIEAVSYIPETVMDKNSIAYSSACLKCKSIRHEAIRSYLKASWTDQPAILVTGHNADDVSSYLLENIARSLDGCGVENRNRFLETTNKFLEIFRYSAAYTIYRPLLRESKKVLQQDRFGELDSLFTVIKKECYWSNQRKRTLQKYFEASDIDLDFDRAYHIFGKLYSLPSEEEFRTLPMETYLM